MLKLKTPRVNGSHFRILHAIRSLSPDGGGPPEALRQLARAYRRAGIEVEMLSFDRPEETFLKDFACPVHALGKSFLGSFAFSARLWPWLRRNAAKYDAFVVNGIWSFPGVAIRSVARQSNRPYGVFIHGALDPWFNKQYPLKRIKKRLFWPVQHLVLRDASAVFFTSRLESELALQSFHPHHWRSVVVPYGINDPDGEESATVDRTAQIESLYQRVPQLRGRRYLLFLARIHEKKGCDLLVKAFARLAPSVEDLDLVIAGPDQVGLQAKLQKMCAELGVSQRVHWMGEIQGDLKWGALRACEALVLPSHQENFGIAVVEALAVGRPVLISNQVNIWQDIAADKAGLVEDDTFEGVERLLRRWLALSTSDREDCANLARASYLRRYSMESAISTIVEAVSPGVWSQSKSTLTVRIANE